MSKKHIDTDEYIQRPKHEPQPSQTEQLCSLLGHCGVGHECSPGKVSFTVGTHAMVEGKHGTVATFEHGDDGKIFRVTLG